MAKAIHQTKDKQGQWLPWRSSITHIWPGTGCSILKKKGIQKDVSWTNVPQWDPKHIGIMTLQPSVIALEGTVGACQTSFFRRFRVVLHHLNVFHLYIQLTELHYWYNGRRNKGS
jgi:hypothetical protein